MSNSKNNSSRFDAGDTEMSAFAKALALPVRVAIIRLIVENGNTIPKEKILSLPGNPEMVSKHVAELRALKIIKQSGAKGRMFYSIDQELFDKMIGLFTMFFKTIGELKTQSEPISESETKDKDKSSQFANFGAFVQFHRKELNMSQEILSQKIGIARADLSRIECGKKALETDKLKLLSKVLYVDLPSINKEYFSHRITELAKESGLKVTITTDQKGKKS
jgi:DNA-binding XRE family transcriptional regulator